MYVPVVAGVTVRDDPVPRFANMTQSGHDILCCNPPNALSPKRGKESFGERTKACGLDYKEGVNDVGGGRHGKAPLTAAIVSREKITSGEAGGRRLVSLRD